MHRNDPEVEEEEEESLKELNAILRWTKTQERPVAFWSIAGLRGAPRGQLASESTTHAQAACATPSGRKGKWYVA
jgi:hypothetical protein